MARNCHPLFYHKHRFKVQPIKLKGASQTRLLLCCVFLFLSHHFVSLIPGFKNVDAFWKRQDVVAVSIFLNQYST